VDGKAAIDIGEAGALKLMHQAIDDGLTFFDNCWDYHDGYSEEVMGKAIHDRRNKIFLMTKVCNRDYKGAMANLDDSLKRLQTDHLDLWQFHELVYDNDPDWVFEQGGIKAALEAQKAGKVRISVLPAIRIQAFTSRCSTSCMLGSRPKCLSTSAIISTAAF